MTDNTRHMIAREIAFIVPLFIVGVVVCSIIMLCSGYNPLKEYFGKFDIITWLLSCVPIALGYCLRLYKFVMKWK